MTEPVQAFGEEQYRGMLAALKVSPHPILILPSWTWVQALMAAKPADWKRELVEILQRRATRIRLAEEDPLNWGFEFDTWRDSDALLNGTWKSPVRAPGLQVDCCAAADVLGIFGGNRAGKSWYGIKRGVQTAMLCPKSTIAMLSESEASSIKTVQSMVWYYLKPHFGTLNGKRDAVFKINYSQAGGFTDRKLVLPNGSEIHFLTYNQDPGDFEGWEFGAPAHTYATVSAELKAANRFCPPNIGAVADESMPLAWLKMFSRRLKFRRSKLLWPFTPVKGITPSIKEMVGASAITLESRKSELLPRKNLPDLPPGEMPYIRECQFPGVKAYAIYFFSEYNKFGPSPERTYYDEIRQLCDGKTSDYVEKVAYGFARDSVARAFPKFGPWNVVKKKHLPAIGSDYHFVDPAGSRNWANLWVRVTPAGDHYIYRDWPDAQTYGEWAVPTEREVNETNRSGWDGDQGPAQAGMGMGIIKIKQMILECEKVGKGSGLLALGLRREGETEGEWEARLAAVVPDPKYRAVVAKVLNRGGELAEIREEIVARYVDPRAGKNEKTADDGGTCIIDEFDETQVDAHGRVVGPSLELIPASGVSIDEGLTLANELLDYNQEEKLVPLLNAPKLYVCEDCHQVIWMLENYTGRGGEKGACKDFADLLRYMALAKLEHVDVRASGRAGGGF